MYVTHFHRCSISCFIPFWGTKYNTDDAFRLAAYCTVFQESRGRRIFTLSSLILPSSSRFAVSNMMTTHCLFKSRWVSVLKRRMLLHIRSAPYPCGGLPLISLPKDFNSQLTYSSNHCWRNISSGTILKLCLPDMTIAGKENKSGLPLFTTYVVLSLLRRAGASGNANFLIC